MNCLNIVVSTVSVQNLRSVENKKLFKLFGREGQGTQVVIQSSNVSITQTVQ